MANSPFDREVMNPRERPLSSDINLLESYADQATRYLVENVFCSQSAFDNNGKRVPYVPNGDARFFGDSFMLQPVSGLQIQLQPGLGFFNANVPNELNVGGIIGLNDLSVLKPLVLQAPMLFNVPTPDPSNPRIDLLEISWQRLLTDATSRDVLNAVTGVFEPASIKKTLSWALDGTLTFDGSGPLNYKVGTPGVSPTAPAVSTGYAAIGYINVAAAAATIDFGSLIDFRLMFFPGGSMPITFPGVSFKAATNPAGPTSGLLQCYPGVRVGGFQHNVGSPMETAVIIIAGRTFGSLNLSPALHVTPYYSGATSANLNFPYNTSNLLNVVIDTFLKASLADVTISALPIKAAIGQPCIGLNHSFTNLNGSSPTMGVAGCPASIPWVASGVVPLF